MDKKKPFTKNLKEEAGTALEKTKAKAQEAEGVVKEAAGKATDNTKMKVEGHADQFAGKAKDAAAKAKDSAHDADEKLQKDKHNKH